MESRNGELRFSPSDLTEYLGCAHASALSRAAARGERSKAFVGSAYAELIFAKGDQHEAAYLARLRADGRDVVEVGRAGDFATGAARTAELMREGADVIYQGAFVVGAWRGLADFVERVDAPSDLGDWSYRGRGHEARARAGRAVPCAAAVLLQRGCRARAGCRRRRWRISSSVGRARDDPAARGGAVLPPSPNRRSRSGGAERGRRSRIRASTAASARSGGSASAWWRAEDHLSRVAWIRRDQVDRLTGAGIRTRRALAALPRRTRVPDLRALGAREPAQQARLQVEADSRRAHTVRAASAGPRAWLRAPAGPSPGDVMFDLEGDPLWTPSRELTFLFGLLLAEERGLALRTGLGRTRWTRSAGRSSASST